MWVGTIRLEKAKSSGYVCIRSIREKAKRHVYGTDIYSFFFSFSLSLSIVSRDEPDNLPITLGTKVICGLSDIVNHLKYTPQLTQIEPTGNNHSSQYKLTLPPSKLAYHGKLVYILREQNKGIATTDQHVDPTIILSNHSNSFNIPNNPSNSGTETRGDVKQNGSMIYPIVFNKGCHLKPGQANVWFFPQKPNMVSSPHNSS